MFTPLKPIEEVKERPALYNAEQMFTPLRLIEEVKKRPNLYNVEQNNADRELKLALWKEVGASIYQDWEECNKATAYDRVLQLQRKWRSLRDAYNRELRARRTGIRVNKRPYIYFKKMSFLGGQDGDVSDAEEYVDNVDDGGSMVTTHQPQPETAFDNDVDPLTISNPVVTRKKPRKLKIKKQTTESESEEVEMPMFNVDVPASTSENDSDRLFLLSFLPEMRQLPLNIKMWTRAQIANIMQEAVACHFNNTVPGRSEKMDGLDIKMQRRNSSD